MSKTLLILNPNSANGNAARLLPQVEKTLRRGGIAFDLARTTQPHEAVLFAENAQRHGYETVIAMGGDGTLNEVVNGVMRASLAQGNPPCTVAILPVGSGNDFAKTVTPHPHWQTSIQRIIAGEARRVDVGQAIADHPAPGYAALPYYFINSMDAGFGAVVAMHAHDFPFLQGTPMYLAAVFKTLVKYSVPRVKITLDDDTLEQTSTMITIANGRCIGGGFWIAPTARTDDGLFDVLVAQGLGRLGILSLLPKVMNGTHIGDPRIYFAQSSHVIVESCDPLIIEADGEIPFIGAQRLQIQILPKRLRIIA